MQNHSALLSLIIEQPGNREIALAIFEMWFVELKRVLSTPFYNSVNVEKYLKGICFWEFTRSMFRCIVQQDSNNDAAAFQSAIEYRSPRV